MTAGQSNSAGATHSTTNSTLRLGTSTYSYWHFTPEKTPIESVLDAAAELGLNGVEILHRQMESEENDYLQQLKRQAFTLGLDLYNLSIHQDFVHDDAEVRQQHIDHTLTASILPTKWGSRRSGSTPAASASRAASTT